MKAFGSSTSCTIETSAGIPGSKHFLSIETSCRHSWIKHFRSQLEPVQALLDQVPEQLKPVQALLSSTSSHNENQCRHSWITLPVQLKPVQSSHNKNQCRHSWVKHFLPQLEPVQALLDQELPVTMRTSAGILGSSTSSHNKIQ